MSWKVLRTNSIIKDLRKVSKNKNLLDAFEKVFNNLKENPLSIGRILSGPLHPARRVRIDDDYRLIFNVVEKDKIVYLISFNRRKIIYKKN